MAVGRVELLLDGKPLGSRQQAPFTCAVSALAAGPHNLRAEAVDTAGHRTSVLVTVTVAPGERPADPAQTGQPGPAPAAAAASPGAELTFGSCNLAGGQGPSWPDLPLLLVGLLVLGRLQRRVTTPSGQADADGRRGAEDDAHPLARRERRGSAASRGRAVGGGDQRARGGPTWS